MALNFSHRPIFPGPRSEDNLVDPIRISNGGYLVDGILKNNVDAFGKPWYLNPKLDDSFHYGTETYHRRGSEESVSKDILDLLPSDPFEMDISSTFTAITDWLEDFEADFGGYGNNEVGVSKRDCQAFAGLNFNWNSALRFQAFRGNRALNCKPNAASCCLEEKEAMDVACPMGFGLPCNRQGISNVYYPGNGSDGVSCPMAVGSMCNLEGINGGYFSEEKVVGSMCNLKGINGGYSSKEKVVGDVSCPTVFGSSACSTQGISAGYYPENEADNVSCPVVVGLACNREGVTSGYCSEREEVGSGSCPVGLGPAHNIAENGITGNMENIYTGCGGCTEDKGFKDCSVGYTENILMYSDAKTHMTGYQTEDWQKSYCERLHANAEETCLGEDHHLVWGLVIGCLGVRDLLSVESVCRSLRATVKNESHLWTKIHIGHPLNEKITDEQLLQLTDRAQGELQCLSLVGCTRITDDGLKCIVGSNPKLTKLSVPGCSKLTIEGIVNNLKVLKSMGAAGVKHLRIGALYSAGVEEYFEELKLLLGIDGNMQQHNVHKPHFYHLQHTYLSCDDDDRALDIEMCPKCEKLRLIYDCTAVGCQRKEQACRACRLCIERCIKCGRCIKDGEYEETFCLDWLCSVCKRKEDPQVCL